VLPPRPKHARRSPYPKSKKDRKPTQPRSRSPKER
jgi:hypothetical protein